MGYIADGPEAVNLLRLIALKGAVSLESKGLKRRGMSARKIATQELGLKPRAPFEEIIAAIQAKIDAEHARGVGFTKF